MKALRVTVWPGLHRLEGRKASHGPAPGQGLPVFAVEGDCITKSGKHWLGERQGNKASGMYTGRTICCPWKAVISILLIGARDAVVPRLFEHPAFGSRE